MLCAMLVNGRSEDKPGRGPQYVGHKGGYGTVRTGDGPRAGTRGRRAHTGRPQPGARAPVAVAPEVLVVSGGWQIEGLPATVRRAGPQAAERTVEFFTAQIRNPHTRAAYAAAVTRFFTWCRMAAVTAAVFVCPVSSANSAASRSVSAFLMLSAITTRIELHLLDVASNVTLTRVGQLGHTLFSLIAI